MGNKCFLVVGIMMGRVGLNLKPMFTTTIVFQFVTGGGVTIAGVASK